MQLSIRDNGDGFTKSDFEALMKGGIGNSEKRTDEAKHLVHNRPVIGRLGIGMLGIAQICGRFTITSKPIKGEAFRATVTLYDLIKEKLDRDDPDVVHTEPEVGDGDGALKTVDVGTYDFDKNVDVASIRRGTHIVSDDVHPTFIKRFQDSLKGEKFKEPSQDWAKCVNVFTNVHSLNELGDYWRLLWELAASCPIPYSSDSAVPGGLIRSFQGALVQYKFSLIVDGIALAKPISLRRNPGGGFTKVPIGRETKRIYGRDLTFAGYIVVQEGKQLKPDELRGIMIRIKQIGIGYYDASMLEYSKNQGPRAKWLTGEIYVEKGLEDALNVDRDSFNRFHPEYRALQERVHKILDDEVFPEVYKQIDVRSERRAAERRETREHRLRSVLEDSVGKKVRIKTARHRDSDESLVDVRQTATELQLTMRDPEVLQVRKPNQQLAASVLALFDIASKEDSNSLRRRKFEELLVALLARW